VINRFSYRTKIETNKRDHKGSKSLPAKHPAKIQEAKSQEAKSVAIA